MKDRDILELKLRDWPLPDPYLLEIGRVAATWAQLESLLNLCIGKLAGFNDLNDPKAFILITHSSFPQRLDILSALCEQLAAEFPHLERHRDVVQSLKQAQRRRNDFMHYSMAVNPNSEEVEMAKGTARGKVKVGVETVSIADLRRSSIAIHDAQRALYKLVLGRDIPPIWENA